MIAALLALLFAQASGGQQSNRISEPPQNSAMRNGSGRVPSQIGTGAGGGSGGSQSGQSTATNQMTLTSGGGMSDGMESDGQQPSSGQQSMSGQGDGGSTSYDNVGLRQQGSQQNR